MGLHEVYTLHYTDMDLVNLKTGIRLCEINLGRKYHNMEDFFNEAINEYLNNHAYSEEEE